MTAMKNALLKTLLIISAFVAAACSAVFISSCGREESFAQQIINAEKKSFGADEYYASSSLSVHFDGGITAGYFGAAADWCEIIEDNNKVEYFHTSNDDKLYRARGFDFTFSNYGYLKDVKKSGNNQLIPQLEPDKLEDFDGTEITLEQEGNYSVYNVKVGKDALLEQIKDLQPDSDDLEDFDLSDIDFGDEIIIKYCIDKDGFFKGTNIWDLRISVDVDGVKVGASMYMSFNIQVDREKIVLDEVGQCMNYAEYYTDEDKTVKWIKNNENPEAAELVSEEGHLKGYKIANYGKEVGYISGDKSGAIAAASYDEKGLFSYIDIYDKDLRNVKTVKVRGKVKQLQLNNNFISLNLEARYLDGSEDFTRVVIDLNDGNVVFKDKINRFDHGVLFGNALLYSDGTNELNFYDLDKDKYIKPLFNGKPINGSSVEVNSNGNVSVMTNCEDGIYLLEINDSGEVIASRKKEITTFGDDFIGKYWVGADFNDSDKKVYYNAHEEVYDIDIGEYEGNGQAQFMYIDDKYAVILDSFGSGYFVYDFQKGEYVLKSSDKELGIIEFRVYLGSENWLTSSYYDDCIYIFDI